jgi:hypothetical protein
MAHAPEREQVTWIQRDELGESRSPVSKSWNSPQAGAMGAVVVPCNPQYPRGSSPINWRKLSRKR